MLILALLLIVIGFLHMAVTINSHFRLLYGRQTLPPRRARILQLIGLGWLALAIWPCTSNWSVQVGLVVWVGLLHIGALLISACLTWKPDWFRLGWRYAGQLRRLLLPGLQLS